MRVSLTVVIAISSLGSLVGQEPPVKEQPVQQPRAEAPSRAPQPLRHQDQRHHRGVVRIANPEIEKALVLRDLAVRKDEARVQWGVQVGSELGIKGDLRFDGANQVRLVAPGLVLERPDFFDLHAAGRSVVLRTRVAGPLAHGRYAQALRELESVEDALRSARDRKDILDEVDRAMNLVLRVRCALWQEDGRALECRAPPADAVPAPRVILLQGAGSEALQTILPLAGRDAAERFASCLGRLWAADSRARALSALDAAGKELMAVHRSLVPVAPPPGDQQRQRR